MESAALKRAPLPKRLSRFGPPRTRYPEENGVGYRVTLLRGKLTGRDCEEGQPYGCGSVHANAAATIRACSAWCAAAGQCALPTTWRQ